MQGALVENANAPRAAEISATTGRAELGVVPGVAATRAGGGLSDK